ncbi:sensor histidine kinase [Opitutus terrae]|uniref:histidine kinase n=1 Tax=Opitutus terrae (strain DSM 11246 / JCM 15787 / PB90-1) TaxID=452637 RepID=B1ZU67_OPITP|nr:HAMP domain-containing sensor histidine kinase [Opitutus terrae]ACB76633.1 histidine kinase [Opitutus terrae PB90-1]
MTPEPGDAPAARMRRMEAANAWLAGYASFLTHDLRNPLTAANGFLSLLDENTLGAGSAEAEYLAHAKAALRDLQAQLEGLAGLASELSELEERYASYAADTAEAVHRVWAHVQAHTRTRATLRLGVLPPVGVSRLALERMLYWLIDNAVRTAGPAGDPQIAVTAKTQGERVALEVSAHGGDTMAHAWGAAGAFDSGGGPPQPRDEGLRCLVRLVQCQGGRVRAQRHVAGGASVVVELPAVAKRS